MTVRGKLKDSATQNGSLICDVKAKGICQQHPPPSLERLLTYYSISFGVRRWHRWRPGPERSSDGA